MQLSRRSRAPGTPKRGFIQTGAQIVRKETPLGLYKGLGAVMTGIVPKMAIRFTSFEAYKQLLADRKTGVVSGKATFVGKFGLPSFSRPPFPRHADTLPQITENNG
jgi:solute carrier family 25 citrate transporter 1